MRILILSQYYPPESLFIPRSIGQHLSSRGHSVRVLTGFPNYPTGRVFAGYSQSWRHREGDGAVDVLRVPLITDHSQSAALRFANYFSFGVSASTAYSFARGADVIYVYATQMTPALAPWLWRTLGGAPYVLHVQDLWPDSITGSSLVGSRLAARSIQIGLTPWLSSLYRHSSAVIGIAPTMVETLVKRGVQRSKAHLVYNWAEEEHVSGSVTMASVAHSDGATRVLYAGNVGDMQDLETAVLAAHAAADTGIYLTIVGDGVALPRVRELADRLGATNVEFRGRVPRHAMAPLYASADYALVSLKDLPAFRGTIPSKLQASLGEGLPVITTVQGDVRRLVDDLGLGFSADAEDASRLETAFRAAAAADPEAHSAMARRARDSYVERFSAEAGLAAVERILTMAARAHVRR